MGGEPPPDDLTPGQPQGAPEPPRVPEPAPLFGPPALFGQPVAPPPQPAIPATIGGNRLRWIAFAAGLLGLVLGATAIRCAALLSGRIDPDLVSTPELEAFGTVANMTRLALIVVGIAAAVAGSRWAARMQRSLALLGDDRPLSAPAHRTARVAIALALVGLVLVVVGTLIPLVAPGRDPARVGWVVVAIGALLLPIAAGLSIWLIGDIERREALQIHARCPWLPIPGDRDRRWPIAAMAALAVIAIVPPSLDVPYLTSDRVCRAAELECRWVLVQADQVANDPRGATRLLHYGLHRATGTRQGTLVIATGGPGISGIAYADATVRALDPRLIESLDIVLFDTRGVGDSDYVDCPVASERYQSALWFDAVAAVIDDFVSACIGETGVDPARLAEFGSVQLAEDIETIRRDLGVERIALYAESYGTVAAQRYVVAHPEHVSALILDGAIDIAQPTDATWIEATRGFDDVLQRTLGACASTSGCRFHDASVWNNVIGSLEGGTVSASYADVDGEVTDWPLTAEAARDTLIDAMYDRVGRMLTLRALTAAEAGDWVPLARMVYSGFGPYVMSRNASDFAYYATSCADRFVGAPDTDTAQYLAWLARSPFASSPAGSVYLSSAACHAWPLPPGTTPPVAVPSTADFPVLILAATGDPITPAAHGRRIYERYRLIADTYLIETRDGPHVTFSRGWPCPDDLVIDLLVHGTRPSEPRTSCPGDIVAPYLEFPDASGEQDPIADRARALDLELLAHPDYWAWDGSAPLAVGCRYGGRIEVQAKADPDDGVERITIDRCAVMRDEPMSGTGTYRGLDEAEFDIDSPRIEFTYRIVGTNRYTMDDTDVSATWSGRYKGRAYEGSR